MLKAQTTLFDDVVLEIDGKASYLDINTNVFESPITKLQVLYGSEDERTLKWRITSPNPG